MMSSAHSKLVLRVTLLIISLACVGVFAAYTQAVSSRNHAKSFLKKASELQVKASTEEQVKHLMQRYGGHVDSASCSVNACGYFVAFDNEWLHRIRLAPLTRFSATFGTSDGLLHSKRFFLVSGDRGFSATVEERSSSPLGIAQSFYVARQWSASRWKVYIGLTPQATTQQHQIAFSFNLECLSRMAGCEDAELLLPSVKWTDESANANSAPEAPPKK